MMRIQMTFSNILSSSEDIITNGMIFSSLSGVARAAFLAYNGVERLLLPRDEIDSESHSYRFRRLQQLTMSSKLVINSRVIGVILSEHRTLEPPGETSEIGEMSINADQRRHTHGVTAILRHLSEQNVTESRCLMWKRQLNDWTSDGCERRSSNSTHTVCQCTEYTYYALVTERNDGVPFTADHTTPRVTYLRLLTCIGAGLSITCLTFILIILYTIHESDEKLSIRKDLCLTFLVIQVSFFIGIYQTGSLMTCILTAGVLHYFIISLFVWLFIELFDLFLSIINIYDQFKSTGKRLWWYYLIGFGVPALITIASIVINPISYGSVRSLSQYCWLRWDTAIWLTLITPCTLSIILSIVFACISYVSLSHNTSITSSIKSKEFTSKCLHFERSLRWLMVLIVFTCLTWISGYLYLNEQSSLPLSIIFTTINVTNAFLVVIYCAVRTLAIREHRFAQLTFLQFFTRNFNDVSSRLDKIIGKTSTINNNGNGIYGNVEPMPVVTQGATQVSNIIHSPSSKQLISGLYSANTSMVSTSIVDNDNGNLLTHNGGNFPQNNVINGAIKHPTPASSAVTPWNYQGDHNNLSSTPDHRYILAATVDSAESCIYRGQATGHIESPLNYNNQPLSIPLNGTTGPILVNPINELDIDEQIMNEVKSAMLNSTNMDEYESKLQQQYRQQSNSPFIKPQRRLSKVRHALVYSADGQATPAGHIYGQMPIYQAANGGNSGGQQVTLNLNSLQRANINQYMEHIYESIDSDSLIYDGARILVGRKFLMKPGNINNDIYAGRHEIQAQNFPTDDESSSSNGQSMDDKPLIAAPPIGENDKIGNNLTTGRRGSVSSGERKNLQTFFVSRNLQPNIARAAGSNSELPDLVKYKCDQIITGQWTGEKKTERKSQKNVNIAIGGNQKVGTYC